MKVAVLLGFAAVAATALAFPGVRRAAGDFLRRSTLKSPTMLAEFERSRRLQLAIVCWFACITCLVEMADLTYAKEITRYKVIGGEYMWQVPAGYLLIFSPVALLAIRPSRRSLSAIVFLCSVVNVLAILPIVLDGLYYWATVVLAIGIAYQVRRGWLAHAWMAGRVVTTALPLTAIVVGLAAVFVVRPIAAERRSLAELPAAPSGPNIVLIVLDTVRAKSLSLYGYERLTSPSLDRFAKKGLVFDRAYSTSPWTLPSHGSMFTGRLPHELSASIESPLDATHATVAELLGKYGYLTAGFVANTWYGGSAWGLARGFQHYAGAETSVFRMFASTSVGQAFIKASRVKEHFSTHDNLGRKSAEEVNGAFLHWLERAETGRPFFAFLNYCDAHSPYLPPDRFATKFVPERPFGHVGSMQLDEWSPDDVKGFRDAYDGSIAYLDSQLDRLFQAIESTPRLMNTVVIITSDHGEQFGEHRLLEHVNSLYLPLLHVPLVIVGPGLAEGQRTAEPVSLRDVAATILQAAGIAGPGLPGQSLVPRTAVSEAGNTAVLLSEVDRARKGTYPEWYPAQRGRLKSLISRDWQYIRNFGDGREELFDLRADPFGLTDRAAQNPSELNEYRSRLDALIKPAPGRK